MKILDIYKKLNCPSIVINYREDRLIAIKAITSENLDSGILYYKEYFVIDKKSETIEIRKSFKDMYNICTEDTCENLFFTTYDIRDNKYYLQFYKIFLNKHYTEELIYEIEIDGGLLSTGFINLNCVIKALNDRYIICWYKDEGQNFSVHTKVVLIDTINRTGNYLNTNDSLLNCDFSGIKITGTQENKKIIIKTGSIGNLEKYEFSKNSNNICDEKLLLYDSSTFIQNVIQNNELLGKEIEFKKDEGTFELIDATDKSILYAVCLFDKESSLITSYDYKKDEKAILISDEYIYDYDYYKQFNENVYGIKITDCTVQIDNLISKKVFEYKFDIYAPYVVFYDERKVVLEFLVPNQKVVIYDIDNLTVINEFINRKADYFIENDTLVLH